jgi:DNA-binding transcriptional regulator GbsR (MarR family)
MENQKNYYAIIPADVRYDKRLTPNAKLLYGEITALCNEKGYCWAGNEYFSELYGVSKTSISKWIKQLSDYNYIQLSYQKRGFQVVQRNISLSVRLTKVKPSDEEKLNRSDEEKLKENNTFNNTMNIEARVRFETLKKLFHDKYKYYHNDTISNWSKETIQLKNILKHSDEDIKRKLKLFESNISAPPDKFWQNIKFLPSLFFTQWDKLTPKRGLKSIYQDLTGGLQ